MIIFFDSDFITICAKRIFVIQIDNLRFIIANEYAFVTP